MNDLRSYRDFVKTIAPPGYKKEINITCVGMLVYILAAALVSRFFDLGIEIPLLYQLPSVMLIILILFTYLPVFSLLLAATGAGSVILGLINGRGMSGYLLILSGVLLFVLLRRLRVAFVSYKKDGKINLSSHAVITLGASRSDSKISFTTDCACPNCGATGLCVNATTYSRFALRTTSANADWETHCPSCGSTTDIKRAFAKKLAIENGKFAEYRRAEFVDLFIAPIIISFVVMLGALIMSIVAARGDRVVYSSDIYSPSLNVGRQLICEKAEILGCFATENNGAWNGDWSNTGGLKAVYAIVSVNANEQIWLLPVRFSSTQDVFPAICAFEADPGTEPFYMAIRGYIDRIPVDLKNIYKNTTGMLASQTDATPIDNLVNYWDSETESLSRGSDMRIFQFVELGAAFLCILFFLLDRYVNSSSRAERIQARYDSKSDTQRRKET